ncbi:mucoidy inhibitor MuiA family protein [Mucilaginibacter terrenus]|uniref:Mucoidy inhibitor MuiA family protein n=1 Tax=Mucilaginibacter terrenus TaxID=2482727 RepID=A0A3E2NXD7_9SPHI|nr:DUF4139 domain-containing protein [Mucilaginibacter terrenus]RFZ85652.1 mucoidy inhibitor MuiA family protein [Mucilaginibacter terrenus]
MKKFLFIACLLICSATARAEEGQKIASKIENVTVFLNGAQVTRTSLVNIVPGNYALVFENLSPNINVPSIQVRAAGDFTILSVKHERNFLGESAKTKQTEELQTMQKSLKDKIALQTALLNINQEEANMLAKNQVGNGQTGGLDVVKLRAALDFQTLRLTEIKKKELVINNELEKLNEQLQKYDSQLDALQRSQLPSTSNIVVNISSKIALQANFTLSYAVGNAFWYPTYDIRAKNVNSPITIAYKANVSQRCGEDWKNVKLTLSTGDPSVSGVKPELNPYYLNLYTPRPLAGKSFSSQSLNEVVVVNEFRSTNPVAVNPTENQTNIEFKIQNPFSIPNDGKPYTVEIDQVTIPATYQYYVAPKLNTDVFLNARIIDWTKFNFLSGEASIFFEGTFVGKSVLDTHTASDTLQLSLGIDKSILVKRTLQKDLNEKQGLLGSSKKETRDWLISVKNRKTQPVNILVQDQVPVSQNTAIEVDAQETSGAEMDKVTGKLSWNLTLAPQEAKQLRVKYQVKYPKNQVVIVQ